LTPQEIVFDPHVSAAILLIVLALAAAVFAWLLGLPPERR